MLNKIKRCERDVYVSEIIETLENGRSISQINQTKYLYDGKTELLNMECN